MKRLALIALFFSAAASAQTMYRWVDKKGQAHYTDDPTTAPKGAKIETTDGVPLTISNEAPERPEPKGKKNKKQDVDLNDESAWRKRFAELRQRIASLKSQVDKDAEATKDDQGEMADLADMAFGPDQSAKAAKARLAKNQEELTRQQRALEELEMLADELKIPKSWRDAL